MRWTPGGTSDDIEDRRSGGGGGFGGIHLGIGGTIVVLVLSFIFKQDLFSVFSGPENSADRQSYSQPADSPAGQREVQFVSFVLDDVQHTWERLFSSSSRVPYRHAKLVLFRDYTSSGCGTAQTATGPFYCPEDEKVYIDLGFFQELQDKFGAPGEFAQAYVLAHEIGHHVQKLLGIEGRVAQLQERNTSSRNALSVRLELQADCFAGVWGHSTEQRNIINESDVTDGLRAAAAVGDDRLQRMATGHVNPETFTHGSSAERDQWFQNGLRSGEISACDTFGNR